MSVLSTKRNGADQLGGMVGFWEHECFKLWLSLWQDALPISEIQGKIFQNWWHGFTQGAVLAPLKLWQDILPGWVFGEQENYYLTSDWEAEKRICAKAAGYGSQLGTLADCLQVYRKALPLADQDLTEKEKKALFTFGGLVDKVKRLKEQDSKAAAEPPPTPVVNPIKTPARIKPAKPAAPRHSKGR